jgi:ribosome maturation protein Sdo1
MAKKKKVLKPKVVKAKKENLDDFFLDDAKKIEREIMDKGSIKLNKDLKKVW